MRKLLLAATALTIAGVGSALASGSDSITVTTFVPQSCTVSIASTNVALPANGDATAPEAFSYTCNYGTGTADLTFSSGSGGVTDGSTTYVYNITPSTGPAGTSAAPVLNTSGVNATPNTPTAASFTLDLVDPIVIAGTYTDTLTISIAP